MSDRIIYFEQQNTLEIHIATKKEWVILLFILPYLVLFLLFIFRFWYSFFVSIIVQHQFHVFLFAILIIFSILSFYLLIIWFWLAFGKEIIKISGDKFIYKRAVFGLGRAKVFMIAGISNIHIVVVSKLFKSPSEQLGISGGSVVFDYSQRTFRFGLKLEKGEAESLVEKLREYLPEKVFR